MSACVALRPSPVPAALSRSHSQPASALLPLVYAELRRLAESRVGRAPRAGQLDATALVHEAYLRLAGDGARPTLRFDGRGHFFFAAARAMRDVLVEHHRRERRLKRGGGLRRVAAALDTAQPGRASQASEAAAVALHDALRRLERDHKRRYQIVIMRFFAGLTIEQTAAELGVTTRTVERDWRAARERLCAELFEPPAPPRARRPSRARRASPGREDGRLAG